MWVLLKSRYSIQLSNVFSLYPAVSMSLRSTTPSNDALVWNWLTGRVLASWIWRDMFFLHVGTVFVKTIVVEAAADRDHRHHDPRDVHPRRHLPAGVVSSILAVLC